MIRNPGATFSSKLLWDAMNTLGTFTVTSIGSGAPAPTPAPTPATEFAPHVGAKFSSFHYDTVNGFPVYTALYSVDSGFYNKLDASGKKIWFATDEEGTYEAHAPDIAKLTDKPVIVLGTYASSAEAKNAINAHFSGGAKPASSVAPAASTWTAPAWSIPGWAQAWIEPTTSALDATTIYLPCVALYEAKTGAFAGLWVRRFNDAGESFWHLVSSKGTLSHATPTTTLVATVLSHDYYVLGLGDTDAHPLALGAVYATAAKHMFPVAPPTKAPHAPKTPRVPKTAFKPEQLAPPNAPAGPETQPIKQFTPVGTPILAGAHVKAQDDGAFPIGTVLGPAWLPPMTAAPKEAFVYDGAVWRAIKPDGSTGNAVAWAGVMSLQQQVIRLVGKNKVPPASLLRATLSGIVFPAPRAVGLPPVEVAPTLDTYLSLPLGTVVRTDVPDLNVTVYALRRVDGPDKGNYAKINADGSIKSGSKARTPETLAQEAVSKAKNKLDVWIVALGHGVTELPAKYVGEWLAGKTEEEAVAASKAQQAQVIAAAAGLGVDPRIAALFTPTVVDLVKARKGIPFFGSWTPHTPNPRRWSAEHIPRNLRRFIPTVRSVLRIPEPTIGDLERAQVLEASGLPLEEAFGSLRRNPVGPQPDLVQGMAHAIVEALGGQLHTGGSSAQQKIRETMNDLLDTMYASGGTPRPEHTHGAQYFRYLVLARALGMWPDRVDPGARAVIRGFSLSAATVNDQTGGGFRILPETKQQIQLLVSDGLVSPGASYASCIQAWIQAQTSGTGGYVHESGLWRKAKPGELTPPTSYAGKMALGDVNAPGTLRYFHTHQKRDVAVPYPTWAGAAWANVQGLLCGYFNQTFQHFTFTEWGAVPWSYPTQSSNGIRANTRDPRFVLLPASTIIGGPMAQTSFRSEAAVLFVSIDDAPLVCDWVTFGHSGSQGASKPSSTALLETQIEAWWQARPPYTSGPSPGPMAETLARFNPRRRNPASLRPAVQTLHFDRRRFPSASDTRTWAKANGYKPSRPENVNGRWTLEQARAAGFKPGSFKQEHVAPGVIAIVGDPR